MSVAVTGRLLLLLDVKGGLRAKAAERVVTSARSVKQRRRNGELSQWVLKAGTHHQRQHARSGGARAHLAERAPPADARGACVWAERAAAGTLKRPWHLETAVLPPLATLLRGKGCGKAKPRDAAVVTRLCSVTSAYKAS